MKNRNIHTCRVPRGICLLLFKRRRWGRRGKKNRFECDVKCNAMIRSAGESLPPCKNLVVVVRLLLWMWMYTDGRKDVSWERDHGGMEQEPEGWLEYMCTRSAYASASEDHKGKIRSMNQSQKLTNLKESAKFLAWANERCMNMCPNRVIMPNGLDVYLIANQIWDYPNHDPDIPIWHGVYRMWR